MNTRSSLFHLAVRQQPSKARLCSFKEKVDRRPIDPPPIIQLLSNQQDDEYLQNPYFFLYATLTDGRGETDLHFVNGNRTTAGTVVQSLHKLKDHDNTDGGFFIFSDISVRLEGYYRLKFTLYEIEGCFVNRLCSIVSDVFQVYSPKSFPGMSESTFLTRSFSDQGVRIRIRKEPRSSSSSTSTSGKRRKRQEDYESDEDDCSLQDSPMPRPQPHSNRRQSQYQQLSQVPPLIQYSGQQQHPSYPSSSAFYARSPSPLPEPQRIECRFEYNKPFDSRPTLPSPKEIFRPSPMSMQNLLSSNHDEKSSFPLNPTEDKSRLFTTRVLPLPMPSHHVKNDTVDKIKQPIQMPTSSSTTSTSTTTSNSSSPWLHNRGQLPSPLPSTTTSFTPPTNAIRRP
ncbi:velvet factor-domain-containing protein [Parasitella parasitica]|nr:velvet factor-domain-containing protein [Parasitella parasitica]